MVTASGSFSAQESKTPTGGAERKVPAKDPGASSCDQHEIHLSLSSVDKLCPNPTLISAVFSVTSEVAQPVTAHCLSVTSEMAQPVTVHCCHKPYHSTPSECTQLLST